MRARGDRARRRKEKKEMESRNSKQTTRFKKRLQRLREHHNECLLKNMPDLQHGTQSSGSPNQGETSSEPSKERHAASNICEASLDTGEEPDVPPLMRTDSVILTKEYLKQISKVVDNSEASVSCIESSGDEYIPPKESGHDSCSEGSDNPKRKVPLIKLKKSQRTYRKKTQRRDTSDKDSRISESESSDDTNAVSVMKLEKKPDGARVYNKAHYCLYCPIKCYKMARHLARRHSSEPAVAKALSFPLKSKARKLHLDLIRNKGDRAHNNEVLKSGCGTLVPSQQSLQPGKPSDYMHCINCQALLKRKALWRHMSRCRLAQKCDTKKPGKSRIQSLCAFAQPVPDGVSRKVWELINSMHQDEVTQIVREEKSILRFGEHLYAKHGHDKTKYEYIRQKMREIARLIQHSRKAGKLNQIQDFYVPSNFNFVIEAVKGVAGFDEDKNLYKTPSLALKLGHSLKKIADILECEAHMAESVDKDFLENLKRARGLFEKKWDVCVSSSALQTLKEAKWNTPQLLPFTEDVKKMHMHLNKCREEYQDKLKTKPNRKNWSKLANVTLCEVILFNRRREGEVSKMPLSAFTLRDTSEVHSDLAEGLSELEQKLCQHFQRIEIRGKRNRKVPVLLTPDMLSSMELLVAHRRECGVPDDNPFFFSRPEADTHLRGSDAIRQTARECGAKHPETLSSTKLRKQVSTLSTVLNLKDNEMDTLANFLGHDIRVHRQYYRLPEGTLQLAKVSKVLIALEQGRLSEFKGMTMDQIQLDPEEEVPEVVESDLSETEMDSTLCSPSSGSSRSKSREPVPDDSDDECTAIVSSIQQRTTQTAETDSDDPEPGPSALQMRQDTDESDSDAPKPGPSTYKKRKPEPDIAKPETAKRRSWSAVEVRAVEKTLNSFIQSAKVPGKSECMACIEASPEALQSRTWTAVKFYVKNRITAIQRESARRGR